MSRMEIRKEVLVRVRAANAGGGWQLEPIPKAAKNAFTPPV